MSGLRSLLLPLTPLYSLGLALRERRLALGREPIRRLRFPVISIGNLSAGGAGKTPLTIALAQALSARGLAVDVLSRGYGRRSTVPIRVDPAGSPKDFGDEPLLIARAANVPVYVAPQRYDAGLLAETESLHLALAQPQVVHLLDDGFQHRQLHRDLDILLLNREDWHDRLLPAGYLREALRAALRAHVIAVPADDPTLESDLRNLGSSAAVWRFHRRMEVPPVDNPVLAFCGIARPDQFFAGLAQAGIDLAGRVAFPDHYHYSARDLDRLSRKARATGATSLLTTEKDAIRLRGLDAPLPIATVPLCTQIENASAALGWILDRLAAN
jgi:tetraacyldisaccharide 4'-kinase